MAEHVWTVLCQRAIVDANKGLVSLVDVAETFILEDSRQNYLNEIERAKKEEKQLQIPVQFDLFSQWRRSEPTTPETLDIRVAVTSPEGEKAIRGNYTLRFLNTGSARLQVHFGALILRGLGPYIFEVEKKSGDEWISASKYQLNVILREDVETIGTATAPEQPSSQPPSAPSSSSSPPEPSRPSRRRVSPKRQRRDS